MVYEDGFEKGYTPREAENSPYLAFYININSLVWKIVLSFKKAASVKIKRGRYRAKKPSPKAYQI